MLAHKTLMAAYGRGLRVADEACAHAAVADSRAPGLAPLPAWRRWLRRLAGRDDGAVWASAQG